MDKRIAYMVISLCSINLASCMDMNDRYGGNYSGYSYGYYNQSQMYALGNYYPMTEYGNDSYSEPQSQGVRVPNSYHVGASHSPASFKDRDRQWASSQNPRSYTIQVADGEKASHVAQKLYKAPKNDRMGQIQYQRNGKSYYKGLYGSYDSPEAARKALDALPADIKQGAGITTWGSVQNSLY